MHRAGYFLDKVIRNAERRANCIEGITTGDKSINDRLAKSRKRIDSLSRTFEALIDEPGREQFPRSQVRRLRALRRPA